MTDTQPDLLAYWQNLNAQADADAGTVAIPANVAAKCDAYIAHLQKMMSQAQYLTEAKSWGDLPSAQAQQKKFDCLATGTDRSLDVIESMRILFRRYRRDSRHGRADLGEHHRAGPRKLNAHPTSTPPIPRP